MRAVAYIRVSTAEQGESGAGLEAQRRAVTSEAERRGWVLLGVHEDRASGRSTKNRPGLKKALGLLEKGEADALVVSKLDRLSRSLQDFASLMERSRREGWALVALDLGVDTSTPAGEMVANVMMAVAQWERRVIGQRTKDALAVKREELAREGRKLGRRPLLREDVRRRIVKMRERGMSVPAIVARLEAEGTPTATGTGRWRVATVQGVLGELRRRPA
jgi:DNA invertase Pin-like site-specific DNA recombinase